MKRRALRGKNNIEDDLKVYLNINIDEKIYDFFKFMFSLYFAAITISLTAFYYLKNGQDFYRFMSLFLYVVSLIGLYILPLTYELVYNMEYQINDHFKKIIGLKKTNEREKHANHASLKDSFKSVSKLVCNSLVLLGSIITILSLYFIIKSDFGNFSLIKPLVIFMCLDIFLGYFILSPLYPKLRIDSLDLELINPSKKFYIAMPSLDDFNGPSRKNNTIETPVDPKEITKKIIEVINLILKYSTIIVIYGVVIVIYTDFYDMIPYIIKDFISTISFFITDILLKY
ncbi:hypothetical protein [Methanococcus sp. CF]